MLPLYQYMLWISFFCATDVFKFFHMSAYINLADIFPKKKNSAVFQGTHILRNVLLYIPSLVLKWRRQWQPTPVLLPGKSHGWKSLVGCSPWGCEVSDMTEQLHFHFSLSCIGEGNGLENPRDGEAWWAAVYGVAQSWTWLKWLSSSSSSLMGVRELMRWQRCWVRTEPGTSYGFRTFSLPAALGLVEPWQS